MTTQLPTTRLGCERLESRENPAGNMFVSLGADGFLAISGDAANNSVVVQQDANGGLYVAGLNGTTVNGQAGLYLGRTTPTNVYITPGAGDDYVQIANLHTTGWISVLENGGNFDNDVVILSRVSANGVTLQTRGGNDAVNLNGVYVNNTVTVEGGDGFDTVDYRSFGAYAPAGLFVRGVENQVGGYAG